jgi:glutamate-1-semialdehyde 2,1-aminomutase
MMPKNSQQLFETAVHLIPGGVNSPVRAFGSVGGRPRFMAKAEKQYIWDVEGRQYTDYIGSWGPMILGHNHPAIRNAAVCAAQNGLSFGAATPAEVEMAELICKMVPSIEMVRMVNSGTEAVMSAIRVARGYTGKDKIIKFSGCYHGHCDSMLVKAGSGVMTAGIPDSAGVPKGCAQDTLTANYNDIEHVKSLMEQYPNQIAAVIIEPIAANMGVVLPQNNFLQQLRSLCDQHHILLIFDEVITGFRMGLSGAQGLFGVTPDLTTFGKIIGAGMPVGAYGGKREIMECVSPVGSVYQAGTLSGNPVAMAAGLAQLKLLSQHPEIYSEIFRLGDLLRNGVQALFEKHHLPYQVTGMGSLSCIFFTKQPVTDYESAKTSDTKLFSKYFWHMLEHGIYVAPSQFEAIFLSYAHTQDDIEYFLRTLETRIQSI